MSRWGDSGSWRGDGLRREVFFFPSGGVDLYGSLFAAAQPSRPYGVVACGSWGVEADRTDPVLRAVALEMARLGGAGLVFHWPGYGDSHGDLAQVGLEDLVRASQSAVEEASRRCPGLSWIFAGFMLGAAVACLAQREAGADRLVLVQPALQLGEYFERLLRTRRPLAPGSGRPRELMEAGDTPGMAYGYPVPARLLGRAEQADAEVAAALESFRGEGAVIRHPEPDEPDRLPERFDRVDVPGTWRFGSLNNPRLARATIEWLQRRTSGSDRYMASGAGGSRPAALR